MTPDMHKAPSVARKALPFMGNATPVARFDISTSEGGRRYIADFFATELRRHDFARYINTHLAADFACALAQHLAATGKQQVGEVLGDALHISDEDRAVLQRIQDALPTVGLNGWTKGVEVLERLLRDSLASRQPGAQEQPSFGQVREIRIPARNKLDPISVFVQDQAAGRGRIVVTCYGNAWQGFWNAMGDRAVMQFVAKCDPDYVAGSMLQGRQTRIAKHDRDYATRIAAEVIAEFRTLIDDQRDAAPGPRISQGTHDPSGVANG